MEKLGKTQRLHVLRGKTTSLDDAVHGKSQSSIKIVSLIIFRFAPFLAQPILRQDARFKMQRWSVGIKLQQLGSVIEAKSPIEVKPALNVRLLLLPTCIDGGPQIFWDIESIHKYRIFDGFVYSLKMHVVNFESSLENELLSFSRDDGLSGLCPVEIKVTDAPLDTFFVVVEKIVKLELFAEISSGCDDFPLKIGTDISWLLICPIPIALATNADSNTDTDGNSEPTDENTPSRNDFHIDTITDATIIARRIVVVFLFVCNFFTLVNSD